MLRKLIFSLFSLVVALVSTHGQAPGTDAAAPGDRMAAGRQVYMTVCVACHQPTGMGLPGVFPPLLRSEYIAESPERLAAMILKGVAGAMTVDGKVYNNIMPGQELMLSDQKIADVMTFSRANFGNAAPPVSVDLIAATRKKFADRKAPWTEAELKAWKDDAATAPAAAEPAK